MAFLPGTVEKVEKRGDLYVVTVVLDSGSRLLSLGEEAEGSFKIGDAVHLDIVGSEPLRALAPGHH